MPRASALATVASMNLPTRPWDAFAPTAGATAEQLARVADALAWPLLLLRADATLVHANLAARRLLRQGRTLCLMPGQRVQPAAAVRQPAFNAALQTAANGGPPQTLRWAAPGERFVATLSALAAADSPAATAVAPALLLLAMAPAEARAAEVRPFAAMHGLSAAETRVLHCLARGLNSSAAAAALGVTPATVRSQTAALRRKTGQPTVGALLKALAALPPLELGDSADDA